MANIELIKQLRSETGAGIADVKEALEISNDNLDDARAFLHKKGLAKAEKRSDRETNQGIIASYIHTNNRIGVLVEINCETDFVAKNEDFVNFGKEVAMQIAAMNPLYLAPSDVPETLLGEFTKEVKNDPKFAGKPEQALEGIIKSKLETYAKENSLITQNYFKDTSLTIDDMTKAISSKVGEAVRIGKFTRFEVGN